MAKQNVLTLDQGTAPAVNLHLAGTRWEGSCPDCGYALCWADDQELAERLAARATTCPICHPPEVA
jgi:hypothetical protein